MRRPKRQHWHNDIRARLSFEREARSRHPGLTSSIAGRGYGTTVTYQLSVAVPEYRTRRVAIALTNGFEPYNARITADGPTTSPHRFRDGRLCIWHPRDPDTRKWVGGDGLAELITHATIHLFKEAYWRETGEWLGPEALHETSKESDDPGELR